MLLAVFKDNLLCHPQSEEWLSAEWRGPIRLTLVLFSWREFGNTTVSNGMIYTLALEKRRRGARFYPNGAMVVVKFKIDFSISLFCHLLMAEIWQTKFVLP